MLKKVFVGLLLAVVAVACFQYVRAPVFWQRTWHTLSSPGQGAYSAVFDFKAAVPASSAAAPLPEAAPGKRTIAE